MRIPGNSGWTAKSVGMATVASLLITLVFKQLAEFGIGATLLLESMFVSALGGSIVLGLRHRGTWLLSLLLFLPSMMFVLFWISFAMGIGEGGDLP